MACGAGQYFFRGAVGDQAAQLRLETLVPFALLSRKAGSNPLAQIRQEAAASWRICAWARRLRTTLSRTRPWRSG
jgi:hypothetical protein